jgi:hypothetical protein
MQWVRRWSRTAGQTAVPLAVWAALPAIQVCALRWDQLSLATLARCSVAAGLSSATPCTDGAPRASAAAPASEPDPCREHVAAQGTRCPFAEPGVSHARSRERSSGHAYCLEGLNGGLARHAPAPRLERFAVVVAVIPGIAEAGEPVVRRTAFAPATWARPPTRPWFRLPPSRAPPRCV